jgi:hypothetical protein
MRKKGSTDEEPQKADGEKESAEVEWPSVLRIGSGEEFQQSLAVAQLAFRLWQESKTSNVKLISKASPKDFLADAWELIEGAYTCVVRPQSNKEYLAEHHGSDKAMEDIVGRILIASYVPFQDLCDPEYKNRGETKTIHGVKWIVYRSELGFDKLFWAYWEDCRMHWRNAKRSKNALPSVIIFENRGKETRIEDIATFANDKAAWKKLGQKKLKEQWKRHGLLYADFLALAKFRREHDKRVLNLRKKPKRKPKRAAVNGRAVQRNRRAH